MALCAAACRRSGSSLAPTPDQVSSALEEAPFRSPYSSYTVGKVVPESGGRFTVLFRPVNYEGVATPLPFPLEGHATNGGFVVYCPEQGIEGRLNRKPSAIFIPAGRGQAGAAGR